MWQSNPATAYVVLGLGNLLGGITKGVTGFGSAILNLCTWIVFVVARVQSGSLQQAVICEALSSTLVAPWLLYATRAHATADFRTVVAISVFVALSSPLGAAILAKLDSKSVELAMASSLLAILVAEQLSKRVFSRCRQRQHGSSMLSTRVKAWRRQQRQRQEAYSTATDAGADAAGSSAAAAGLISLSQYSGSPPDCISTGSSPLPASPLVPLLSSDKETAAVAAEAAEAADCTVMFSPDGDTNTAASTQGYKYSSSSRPDAAGSLYAEQDAVVTFADVAAPCQDQGHQHSQGEDDGQQPLLSDTTNGSASTSGRPHTVNSSSSGSGRGESGAGSNPGSSWRQTAKAWCVVLGIGSVAGTLSGVMEGLTGMNGPPIMFMYRRLNTPKATVRGNNAFLNLLQMRLVPYWYMGLIVRQDLQLYAVSCAAAGVGVVVGDKLSQHINQQAFQSVLGVLMVLCCALMFASGLGLVE